MRMAVMGADADRAAATTCRGDVDVPPVGEQTVTPKFEAEQPELPLVIVKGSADLKTAPVTSHAWITTL